MSEENKSGVIDAAEQPIGNKTSPDNVSILKNILEDFTPELAKTQLRVDLTYETTSGVIASNKKEPNSREELADDVVLGFAKMQLRGNSIDCTSLDKAAHLNKKESSKDFKCEFGGARSPRNSDRSIAFDGCAAFFAKKSTSEDIKPEFLETQSQNNKSTSERNKPEFLETQVRDKKSASEFLAMQLSGYSAGSTCLRKRLRVKPNSYSSTLLYKKEPGSEEKSKEDTKPELTEIQFNSGGQLVSKMAVSNYHKTDPDGSFDCDPYLPSTSDENEMSLFEGMDASSISSDILSKNPSTLAFDRKKLAKQRRSKKISNMIAREADTTSIQRIIRRHLHL